MKKALTILTLISIIIPNISSSLTFDPNNVISDYDMRNYTSMTESDIQSFLDGKGYLGKLLFENYFGEIVSASQIIYKYANQFQISPKYILTTLQKEQSLIESSQEQIAQDELDWAMGYAVCDSCSKNDPLIQKYKGFDNQIYNATRRNKDYYDNPKQFKIQIGQDYKIDNITIKPANQATVSLYTYTPHIQGVQNFFSIWNKYFTKYYPDGTLLSIKGQPGIWLIQDGQRRPFMNQAAFYTRYNPKNVVYTFAADLEKYPIGSPIEFPNYSIFRTKENGNIYMLDNDTLRRISSMTVFKNIGFNTAEITNLSVNDIGKYNIGEDINTASMYPTGAVLQNKETKQLWYVKDGIKHLIATKEIFDINYSGKAIIQSNSNELEQFIEGPDAKLQDGTLISGTSSDQIFIVSNGERREIQTDELFNDLGFSKSNVIKLSDDSIIAHPLGFPLEKTF